MGEVVLQNRIKSLEQRLHQRAREISLLKEMSLFLTISVEKTLELFAYRMGILTSAKFVRVYLVDKTGTKLRLVSGYNLSEKYLEMVRNKFEVSIESAPCGKAIKEKGPYIVNDVSKDEVFSMWRDVTVMLGYASYVGMPLFVADRIIGAVDIFFADTKYFSDDELNLMIVLCNAGALAIENAVLIDKISNISVSVIDEDTGAFNYRHFNETLKREVERAKRYKQQLTLIMMNIMGEVPVHDDDLRLFVATVKGRTRGTDMLFRYSGNTFCLILTHTAQNSPVVSRLYEAFHGIFGEGLKLGLGVSCMPEDGDNAEILITKASEYLD
ncbi:MAG: diguanylate cyclase [Nitrospira sp.]|nr:diguanylate cyclase [Nitrospira sp.]